MNEQPRNVIFVIKEKPQVLKTTLKVFVGYVIVKAIFSHIVEEVITDVVEEKVNKMMKGKEKGHE